MTPPTKTLGYLCDALARAGLLLRHNIETADLVRDVALVTEDSRQLVSGAVFVAVAGSRHDGHAFVPHAPAAGAIAAICEREVPGGMAQVLVRSSRQALGVLLAVINGEPTRSLSLVGITGTNGKTTTSYLVESILSAAAKHPGVIGTVNYRFGGASHDAPYTTPTPAVLHGTLAAMRDAACTHVVMEVSSAALAMDRLAGVQFRVGAFANLTQDHLDVHGSMEAYRDAKALLFSNHLAPDGVAVINVDDPHGEAMATAAQRAGVRILRVACADPSAEIFVDHFESTVAGIAARVRTPRGVMEITSRPLLGQYNVANIALAVGIAEALELPLEAIARGIAQLPGVPGRVERVANNAGLDILVDYAHTPDALENVLRTLRPLTKGRLLCVFGCGGDRDPGKRPKMGAVVARLADLAYVTSDNPRTEKPWAIIEMILDGIPSPHRTIADRAVAIAAAVAEAVPGDIVLIAGKGHEDYQIIGHEKLHFDDREHAAAAVLQRPSYTADALAAAANAELAIGATTATTFSRVHIDGRTAAAGDLYVAIVGEQHDGHAFCAQAVAGGATGVLVARAWADAEAAAGRAAVAPVVMVADDTRLALGALGAKHAATWRDEGPRRIVAITGSAGKTTTKDLVAAALAANGATHAAVGSLNNETGVPLTMLGLRAFHQFAVLEMGMRGAGQIEYLAQLARPDVAVVVNAGTAHMELLGSAEAILRAKCEIFSGLRPDGVAVYPADDARFAPLVRAVAPHVRHFTFGEAAHADIRLLSVTSRGAAGNELEISAQGNVHRVMLRLVGKHNAINACAALATALAAGAVDQLAAIGLAHARAPHMRGELASVLERNVLVDCYNANPVAMAAALHTLAELAGDNPCVAVLGDMLELGSLAVTAHREVGRLAARLGISVVALGDHADDVLAGWHETSSQGLPSSTPGAATAASATVRRGTHPMVAEMAATPTAAATRALAIAAPHQWILVKASRGMRLERVVAAMATAHS